MLVLLLIRYCLLFYFDNSKIENEFVSNNPGELRAFVGLVIIPLITAIRLMSLSVSSYSVDQQVYYVQVGLAGTRRFRLFFKLPLVRLCCITKKL